MPIDRELFSAIAESDRDLREPHGLAHIAAIEDHIRHVFATQRLGRLLAEHPADGVQHIGFTAAVRPDYRGDAFVKIKNRFVGERFEAEQLERL